MSTVSVVGAGGHVGFPFSVVVANAGHMVYGIDINSPLCTKMNAGFIPYVEHGVSEPLKTALSTGNLFFTTKTNVITRSDVIAIMIGTPVDSENNPRLDELLNFIKYELVDNFRKGQLIILRSTVSPGTTELIRDILDSETGQEEGKDYHLVFCPERVAQGHGIEESKKFPQLIGAFNEIGFEKASAFFKTFVENDCFFLTPREAEIGKLITNMYRYVNFALANEFYMISHDQSVNIHKVIEACNKDYPRMNLPLPGPNVGGPCLEVGSRINTEDGFKNIEDINIGDVLLDSDGKTVVTDFRKRIVNSSITFKVRGVKVVSSLDHIHLVSDSYIDNRKNTFASDLKDGQIVLLKQPKNIGIEEVFLGERPSHRHKFWLNRVVLDEKWARIIGLWLAEGHISKNNDRVYWSFGIHEEYIVVELLNMLHEKGLLNAYYFKHHVENATYGPSTTWRVRVDSVWLVSFFQKLGLGKGSKNKRAPALGGTMGLVLVGAWLDGDGCQSKNFICGYSRSKKMILDLWNILLKNGILASVNNNGESLKLSKKTDIEKIIPYTKRFYNRTHFVREKQYESPHFREIDGGWLVKISSVEQKHDPIEVVGIETTTGKYLVENIETHNCLFKDGRFLITDVPYADLINTSFLINEGMPDFIFKQIKSLRTDGLVFKKILILGMAFKANNEDTRNSLSFKMRKVAIKNGCDVICIDPFIAKYRTENLTPTQYDAIILMTPHDKFKDWLSENLSYLMQDTVIVDMWKHFPESKKTTNGIYLIKDIVNV